MKRILLLSVLTFIFIKSTLALSSSMITIERTTSPHLNDDSNQACQTNAAQSYQGPHAAYIGFKITNVGTTPLYRVNVLLDNFATTPSGYTPWGPTGGQASSLFVGTLAPGASDVVYFFVAYPCQTNIICKTRVNVTDSNPGTVSQIFSIGTRSTISATAGGLYITQVSSGNNHVVGGVSDMTVTYNFGNVQANETFNLQPAGNINFNAGAFQLINTEVIQSDIDGINAGDRDKLFHIASGFAGGTNKVVTIRYYFLNKMANISTSAVPYAVQTSGGANPNNPASNVKYNPDYGQTVVNFSTTTSPFSITKTADQFLVNNMAFVNYDVQITNNSNYTASVSSVLVELASEMQLSGIASTSDVNASTSMASPLTGANGTLEWQGNRLSAIFPYSDYVVLPNQSIHLRYQAQTTTAGVNQLQETNAQAFYGNTSTNKAYTQICVTCSNHDNDNLVDILDIDDDNDGISDIVETAGLNATAFVNGVDPMRDDNKNGIYNYAEGTLAGFVDDNGDGVNDRFDRDGDGVVDMIDLDADNDGIQDIVEAGAVDVNYDGMADAVYVDNNQNGLVEAYEGVGTLATARLDFDQDGVINSIDLDSDNDGILDMVENQQLDIDHNGRIDGMIDTNANGWADAVEGMSSIVKTATDINGDGRVDAYVAGDMDSDRLANFLDIDSDADGIVDLLESQISGANALSPYLGLILPLGTDLNQNGIDDAFEGMNYITPLNSDAQSTLNGSQFGYDNVPDFLDIDADNDAWDDLAEGHDADLNLTIDVMPTGMDADKDGLDNAYDNFVLSPSAIGARVSNILGSTTPVQSSTILPERDWRVASSMGPLPVEILSFTGNMIGDAIKLDWTTVSEMNTSEFVVERSTNFNSFQPLNSVEAKGGIGVTTNYNYLDTEKITEDVINLRYRLRIIDNDGKEGYSKMIEVKLIRTYVPTQIKAEPNPTQNGVMHLNYFLAENTEATVSVKNALGQEVLRKTVSGNMLWQTTDIEVSSWAKGVYFVNLNDGIASKIIRVVVE